MAAFHAYLFGVWTMMGLVFIHQIVSDRRRKRKERAFLETQVKICGMRSNPDETNEELRRKLREFLLRGPYR